LQLLRLKTQVSYQQHTTRSTARTCPLSMQLIRMLQRRHTNQLAEVQVHA
jgi:hypothetical protein